MNRTADVLDATLRCLLRYGARRTTMDDIATEMGVSRSAVYQYVRSKDDAVRKLAERLHDRAFEHARAAAAADAPLADRVHGILSAKVELTLGPFAESPHAAELLDEQARVSGDICRAFTGDLHGVLTETLAGEFAMPPGDAAQMLLALTVGLLAAGRTDLLRAASETVLAGLPRPENAQTPTAEVVNLENTVPEK
ncbi:TetR/AcrR family transcriptional regulator [Nocardia huaxiensis]|uniref:TetR/AcrR family transcriptional regulator n=1 Tax=Nocardia huaxiensis TaxID=2755382 RepID=A0A7D6VBU2_9NOCA|nr:TetR/AcrR family transcriptional regulator [Nocardia huaxiensis]QLY30542.1 TetR/AcrR family transcriptional regulator [Nocardia huaxiensis]